MVRCGDIGSYLSTGGVSVSRSRLDVIVETIAALAVSTDILGLLVNVCPAQKCFLGILKRVQTDRTQGHEGCRIDFVYIVTAHRFSSFYRYVKAHRLGFCTPGRWAEILFGSLPYLSSTPRGGLGTFWRRICTAPSAFRPPRLLCGPGWLRACPSVWRKPLL